MPSQPSIIVFSLCVIAFTPSTFFPTHNLLKPKQVLKRHRKWLNSLLSAEKELNPALKSRESVKVGEAGTPVSRSTDVLIESHPQKETIAPDCKTIVMAHQRRVAKKTNEKEAPEKVRNLIAMPKRFISLIVTQTTRETAPNLPNDMFAEVFHAHDLPREGPVLCMTEPLESKPIPTHKLNSPEIQVTIWRWIRFP